MVGLSNRMLGLQTATLVLGVGLLYSTWATPCAFGQARPSEAPADSPVTRNQSTGPEKALVIDLANHWGSGSGSPNIFLEPLASSLGAPSSPSDGQDFAIFVQPGNSKSSAATRLRWLRPGRTDPTIAVVTSVRPPAPTELQISVMIQARADGLKQIINETPLTADNKYPRLDDLNLRVVGEHQPLQNLIVKPVFNPAAGRLVIYICDAGTECPKRSGPSTMQRGPKDSRTESMAPPQLRLDNLSPKPESRPSRLGPAAERTIMVRLIPDRARITGMEVGVGKTCDERESSSQKLNAGQAATLERPETPDGSFCLYIVQRQERGPPRERCFLTGSVANEQTLVFLLSPRTMEDLSDCPRRPTIGVQFFVDNQQIALDRISELAGSITIVGQRLGREAELDIRLRKDIGELGADAVRFEKSSFYRVNSVSVRDDKRIILRVNLVPTFRRLGDVAFRFETSARVLERSCELSLSIPEARRVGPGWPEGLAQARDKKLADENRRFFLYPEPNETGPRGQQGVYRVSPELGNLLISTADEAPEAAVVANKSRPSCPSSRAEGPVETKALRIGFFERVVRDSGPVFVGIVSLDGDAVRRTAQGAFEARLFSFYLELMDRLSAPPSIGHVWELATVVQRQAQEVGRERWLSQSGGTGQSVFPDPISRVTITEALSDFLREYQAVRPISARQIPDVVAEVFAANGIPPDYKDVGVVMVGGSRQGRQTACNDIAGSMTPDLAKWLDGSRRLLILEFQQSGAGLVPSGAEMFQQDRLSDILRCPITDPKLKGRVEVLSMPLPDVLQRQIRDEALNRAVELGQSVLRKQGN